VLVVEADVQGVVDTVPAPGAGKPLRVFQAEVPMGAAPGGEAPDPEFLVQQDDEFGQLAVRRDGPDPQTPKRPEAPFQLLGRGAGAEAKVSGGFHPPIGMNEQGGLAPERLERPAFGYGDEQWTKGPQFEEQDVSIAQPGAGHAESQRRTHEAPEGR